MPKILVRALLGLVALILVIVISAFGYVWHLGDEAMHTAEAAGRFNPSPSDAPPTTFETTIQTAFFGKAGDYALAFCPFSRPSRSPIVPLANSISYAHKQELTTESALRRVSVACHLAGRFSDMQILRLYLHHARFRNEFVGAEAASQAVFGKAVTELDREESIRLAALFEMRSSRTGDSDWEKRAEYVRERLREATAMPL